MCGLGSSCLSVLSTGWGDDGQHDVRRVRGVVKDALVRHGEAPLEAERLARVGIDVVMREVAARDVESNPVPRGEIVASGLGLDRDLVHAPRLHQLRALTRGAV